MFKFKSSIYRIILFLFVIFLLAMSCKEDQNKETIIKGSATILVDENLQSIIDSQIMVFESQYNAKIKQHDFPESEVVNKLLKGEAKIAILSRKLTKEENNFFKNKGITPRVTLFARDAIVFISNKSSNDTIVDLQEVINLVQGKESKIKGLVFDNPNSGTKRYIDSISGVKNPANPKLFSVKSHKDVLKFVSENIGMIGVVGLNPIVEPDPGWGKFMQNIHVMGVRNVKGKPNNIVYYKPTQYNVGQGYYPLNRNLYMLNYQGSAGLGMGFASFIAGDIGQRIILKSGLVPIRIPERNVVIRNQIMNNK